MSETFSIMRKIEVDAGHRIPDHKSKCRNVHGHRYVIEATCVGPLFQTGEQTGMVLDFGFLKEEMVRKIDGPCDHGLMLSVHDPILEWVLGKDAPSPDVIAHRIKEIGYWGVGNEHWSDTQTWQFSNVGKLYIMEDVPTAENLARLWYEQLAPRVQERSNMVATLKKIRVHETPNCYADYEV